MIKEFRLPDVGEGLTEADIVNWHVKPGDTVEVNQVIVEIETAKAVVELPCPFDGTVAKLLADEGQTIDVGTPIISVDVASEAEPSGAQSVLVGYGVRESATTRRPRRTTPATPPSTPPSPPSTPPSPPSTPPNGASMAHSGPSMGSGDSSTPLGSGTSVAHRPPSTAVDGPPTAQVAGVAVAGVAGAGAAPAAGGRGAAGARGVAKPPVRKLAKDLGVDLASLSGTGPQGSITRDDVQRAAESGTRRSGENRIPVRGVRKHTAAAMVASAFTAPHVTEFLTVNVSETMAAVRRVRDLPEFTGMKVSPLLFVARALLVAVARHPMVNSSWDEAAQEIVLHGQVNLGIAVATERGLIVPNVKDAGSMTLADLAGALDSLARTGRDGKATPADLSGGTITITNVGVFGVDAGTPILTPGEAAILAFGKVREAPWVVGGQLAVRQVTTLSLSFDHRIVDGELGSAVLRDIGSMLEDPVRLFAWS